MTDIELLVKANAIRRAAQQGVNTADRVGQMFVDIIDNKINNIFLPYSVLYSDIVTLKSTSSLVVGRSYLITDYRTIHVIPNTSDLNTGSIEQIIVTATAINKLDCIALSTAYPQDLLYYSLENNNAVINGATKGYIYRRIDTVQNNDLPFDFRAVKFRRWQISVSTQDATGAVGNYTRGAVVKKTSTTEVYIKLNNQTAVLFSNTGGWALFPFDNLSYCSPTNSNWEINQVLPTVTVPCSSLYDDYNMWSDVNNYNSSVNNSIGTPKQYGAILNDDLLKNTNTIIFSPNFSGNTIGYGFYNNSINSVFLYNTIDGAFINNAVGVFYNNKISFNFEGNCICSNGGSGFLGNIINTGFKYNIIGDYFIENKIGSDFSSNTVGFGFYENTIRGHCTNNTVNSNFSVNTIESYFHDCIVKNHFVFNVINNYVETIDFTNATHVYENYSCTIGKNSSFALFLSYINGSNVQQIVSATA